MSCFLVPQSSRRAIALAAIALIIPLTGCQTFRKAAGLEKAPPDEFAVLNRAPLSLPPDYTLRPPQAGALRPQETQPTELARQTVFRAGETNGPAIPGAATLSSGEQALLRQAGAAGAPSDIRQLVNQDNSKALETDQGFVNELLFWKGKPVSGDAIDPVKEAKRLQEGGTASAAPVQPATSAQAQAPGQGAAQDQAGAQSQAEAQSQAQAQAQSQADAAIPGGAAPPAVVQSQTAVQPSGNGESATIERKKSGGFFSNLF